MNKYRFSLLLFMLMSIKLSAYFDIRFGTSVLSRDTLGQNDTLLISTSLINLSNQPYNNTISFGFSINGTQNVNQHIFSNPVQGQIIHISSGDSFPVQFKIVLESQYFRAGPDIFVVWPIIPGNNTLPDSLHTSIVIEFPDAINEPGGIDDLKVYYYNQSLFIKNLIQVEASISIYDITGAKIYSGSIISDTEIPLNDRAAGAYIVEIIYPGSTRRFFKVLKQ